MSKEIWKSVKDYEYLYEVSNKGSVRSLYRALVFNPKKEKKRKNIPIIALVKYFVK